MPRKSLRVMGDLVFSETVAEAGADEEASGCPGEHDAERHVELRARAGIPGVAVVETMHGRRVGAQDRAVLDEGARAARRGRGRAKPRET